MTSSRHAPDDYLVSIGLPVYNGAHFLAQTLDSLLAQDFTNFEIIISDNGSTDGTENLCQAYMAKGHRIRYLRNDVNRGAAWNFEHVLAEAKGHYFMWAGSHDLWEPTFISRCKAILDGDKKTVLVYARSRVIDGNGDEVQLSYDEIDTRGQSTVQRTRTIIARVKTAYMIYGLFRTSVIRKCRLRYKSASPDLVILMEVNLLGAVAQIPEVLYASRSFRPAEVGPLRIANTLMRLYPDWRMRKNVRPYWELGKDYLRGLFHAPIPFWQKPYLLLNIVHAYYKRWKSHLRREISSPLFPKGIDKEFVFPNN